MLQFPFKSCTWNSLLRVSCAAVVVVAHSVVFNSEVETLLRVLRKRLHILIKTQQRITMCM